MKIHTNEGVTGVGEAACDAAEPVCRLIGGRRRERLLASIEVPRNTPEKMAEHCYEYFEQGVRGIKAKVGSNPAVEFTEIMIHDLLTDEPVELTDGYLNVPDAPGLGFEPSEEKLERYRARP